MQSALCQAALGRPDHDCGVVVPRRLAQGANLGTVQADAHGLRIGQLVATQEELREDHQVAALG